MKKKDIGELTEDIREDRLCQVQEIGLYRGGEQSSDISAYWNHLRFKLSSAKATLMSII